MTKKDLKFKFIIPEEGDNPDANLRFDAGRLQTESDENGKKPIEERTPNWYMEFLCGESMLLDKASKMPEEAFNESVSDTIAKFKDKVMLPPGTDEDVKLTALFCGAFRHGDIEAWARKTTNAEEDEDIDVWCCQQIVDAYFREKPIDPNADGLEQQSGYTY